MADCIVKKRRNRRIYIYSLATKTRKFYLATPDVASIKSLLTIEPKVEIDWAHMEASDANPWTKRGDPLFSVPAK